MKIKSIQASGFGCFKDWQTEQLDSNTIVVCGPNETGKSTFFNLIETLFYGWRPVTDNPYLPWEGNPAVVSAVIEEQSGEEYTVQRSLRNRAQGTIIKGQTSFNLGNHSLESLAFLPRVVFAEVYFLTVDQLCFPNVNAWQELQDQLLGGQYASFLKPVSGVIADLESEVNSLWRPDRRGKPVARLLDEEILKLTQQRRLAYENEQKLREIEQQLFTLREEQEKLKQERIQLLAELNCIERLLPVKKKLERIKELLEMAGDIEAYRQLPADPQKTLALIAEDLITLAEEIKKAEQKREQYSLQKTAFGTMEQLFIAQADEIGEITKAYAQIVSDQLAVSTCREEIKRGEQRLQDYAANFLLGGWQSQLEAIIKEIDEVALRSEIVDFKSLETQYQQKDSQLEGLRARIGTVGTVDNWRSITLLAGISIVLGLLGIIWLGNTPLGFAAALILLLGVGTAMYRILLKGKKSVGSEVAVVEQEVARLKTECEQKRAKIRKVLQGLPVTELSLVTPDETLLVDLKNMKMILTEKDNSKDKLAQLEKRLAAYQFRVERLLDTLQLKSSGDILKDLRHLEKGLITSRECQITAQHATDSLAEVETQWAEFIRKQNKLIEERELLLNSLQNFTGETLEEKINNLVLRRDYWQQAQTLRKDLESDYPDLKVLEKEIETKFFAENWFNGDNELAAKKIRFVELEEKKEEIKENIARLETELQHLVTLQRVDDVEGAIQQLQIERKSVALKRDRLVVLQKLLKEADRRFRDEHQPDVLQKAGHYLELITEGRYDRLFIKDDGSGLMVRGNYVEQLLNVAPPLSRGTLEQIHLALRLALVEHVDSGRETVPLFLDEVLVNWDNMRLHKCLEILHELAGQRQIFLFTCHDWLVNKMQEMMNAKVIKLG